jgi:hypothetical protein
VAGVKLDLVQESEKCGEASLDVTNRVCTHAVRGVEVKAILPIWRIPEKTIQTLVFF